MVISCLAMANYEITEDRLAELDSFADANDSPIVMVNLLKVRTRAQSIRSVLLKNLVLGGWPSSDIKSIHPKFANHLALKWFGGETLNNSLLHPI